MKIEICYLASVKRNSKTSWTENEKEHALSRAADMAAIRLLKKSPMAVQKANCPLPLNAKVTFDLVSHIRQRYARSIFRKTSQRSNATQ